MGRKALPVQAFLAHSGDTGGVVGRIIGYCRANRIAFKKDMTADGEPTASELLPAMAEISDDCRSGRVGNLNAMPLGVSNMHALIEHTGVKNGLHTATADVLAVCAGGTSRRFNFPVEGTNLRDVEMQTIGKADQQCRATWEIVIGKM